MNLVPYDIEKTKWFKPTANLEILEEFSKSGLKCAKVEGYKHKDARSCYSCLNSSIKRFHMDNIKVFKRCGEVFLVKVE